jgi:hypothetical protein
MGLAFNSSPLGGKEKEMVEIVFVFGFLLAGFEFVVLSMIPPKYRLRMLGSKPLSNAIHATMLIVNLWVHWGTVTGTMSATLAVVASIVTVSIARLVYGTITNDVRTRRGLIGYRNSELIL